MWDLLHACNFAFTRVPIADLSLGWGGTHYVVDVLQKILMKHHITDPSWRAKAFFREQRF